MPASAPGTFTERHRQSVSGYHRKGMRLPTLLGPWLPALFATTLLITIIRSTDAISSSQNFLVCIDPKVERCITWLTNVEEALEIATKLYFKKEITSLCGLSDLVPLSPHRKFIKVVSNTNEGQERQIFCNVKKMEIKDVVDQLWSKIKLRELHRPRRQIAYGPKGRYRGQTQSQYLAIDRGAGKDNGKAEAHSAADSSRASVSGSSGMGQAQSQTMYDPSCEDCVARSDIEAENLKRGPYIVTQHGIPGGTSINGGLLPSGGIGTIAQNGPGSFDPNQNVPGGYGPSPTSGSPNSGGYGPNQRGLPGNNGGFTPNQQSISLGSGPGSFIPNKDISGGNAYYPRQTGSGTPGFPGSGSFSPSSSPGQGMYGNNNFIPGMTNKPSGGGYLDQNGKPGGDNTIFSPSQTGIPSGNFIPNTSGAPGGMGSRDFAPNQLAGNGVYGQGQQAVPGGGGNYGITLDGQPSTSAGVRPSQTAGPDGNGGFRQGVYAPSGGGSPGGIGSNVYNPNQNSIPSQNGPVGSLQSPPKVLGGNIQYGSGFPGGRGGYNGGTNWPISTGSIQGPDGTTYYCCVAGPSNNPQYYKTGNGLGQPGSLSLPGGTGSSNGPNNLMAPPGLYSREGGGGSTTLGIPYVAGTGTNAQLIPGSTEQPSGLGRPGYIQPTFQTQGGTGGQPGLIGSGGELSPSGTISPPGTGSQPGILAPGSHYGPDNNQNGILTPGSPYSPGGSDGQNGLQRPVGQYGPGGSGSPTGLQSSGGQYDPMSMSNQPGLQGPNGQYGPGGVGGQIGLQHPGGQYGGGGIGVQNSLQLSPGQYSPGGIGGQSGLPGTGAQYGPIGPGGQTGQPGIVGQYGPGVIRGQSLLPGIGGPYGPGSTGRQSGLVGTGGQYSPGSTGSQPENLGVGGQYATGSPGAQSRLPGLGGQYGPEFTGGQSGLPSTGGQYGPGGTGIQLGLPGPGGRYSPGSSGGQTGQPGSSRQYSPGITGSQIGQYGPGNTAGVLYPPGDTIGGVNGQGPVGQFGPGDTSGQTGLQSPGGQYGHVGPGVQNGVHGPGGQYAPGAIGGQNGLQTQYVPAGTGGQYGPGGHTGGPGGPGIYGTSPYGYDNQGNLIQNGNYNGAPQNVVDPNSTVVDGDDSEAEASVTQGGNGTVATASSKGGNEKGRAQTHVHGAYTGGGSFSAQAEISGENKAANSEVSGDKKGASSQAQGSGRNNKSQANVQLGSETGSVLTGSLSEGVMHSSNTQVQGSVKGGMADAQARGPGSTSSQAQIGFTPYKEGDKVNEQQAAPFVGGGTSSAQSSGRTGSSQSQLRGSFKYGITYNGAAQAGASLDKDAVFPNRLPFDKIDVYDENNKNLNVNLETTIKPLLDVAPTEELVTDKLPVPGDITEVMASSETPFKAKLGPDEVEEEIEPHSSDDEYGSHTHNDHHKDTVAPNPSHPPAVEGRRSFQPNYNNNADYDYGAEKDEHQPEDYDIDGYGTEGGEPSEVEQYNELSKDSETHQSLHSPKRKGLEVRQTTGGNTQHIVLGSLNDQDAEIIQRNSERPDESKVYQAGERIPGTGGYTIPIGFTGSVKSVASKENTYVVGTKDSPSQAQTVSLTPGNGKVKYTYPATHPRNISPKDLRSLYNPKADDNRYISVSKSVTRALDGENNIRKQYSHTYYTKSSSCGYFTFTCTMVSSAEGRKKVCKPKIPTNPDGTPMRC